jgi:hypothetical protein
MEDQIDHIIIIRFSVIFKNNLMNDNNLFSDKRLETRINLFKTFCLPGIINQTVKDFKVVILYDRLLPDKFKNQLELLIKDYSYIYLHKWVVDHNLKETSWLSEYRDNTKKYSLYTRLDDDDMLHSDINLVLKKNIGKNYEEYLNKIISFRGGKFINYDGDINNLKIFRSKYRKGAIFYSRFTLSSDPINVFTGISHDTVQDSDMIIIKMRNCWAILNHDYEDSDRYQRMKNSKSVHVELYAIYKIFNIKYLP